MIKTDRLVEQKGRMSKENALNTGLVFIFEQDRKLFEEVAKENSYVDSILNRNEKQRG